MKKSPEKEIFGTVICGLQLAVLFEPVWRLNDVLSLKADGMLGTALIFYIIPALSAVLFGASVFSETLKQAFIKWLISLPITFLWHSWFLKINFSQRALNWIIPYYGESSAGGNFAGFILLCSLCFAELIAIIAGLCCTKFVKSEKARAALYVVQKCGFVVSVIIIAVVFYINAIMRPKFPLAG